MVGLSKSLESLPHLLKMYHTFEFIHLPDQKIGDNNFKNLAFVINGNSILKSLDLCGNNLTDTSILVLVDALQNNHLRNLILSDNKIGCFGAKTLALLLVNNKVTCLDLSSNAIGNSGIIELSRCLMNNNTLKSLFLDDNKIGNSGVREFARSLYANQSLKSCSLEKNEMDYESEFELLDSVRHNSTLVDLSIHFKESELQEEINDLTEWNIRERNYSLYSDIKFPWSYRDHVIYILMILNQLPIYNDLHWIVITMLKVKDVVKNERLIKTNDYKSISLSEYRSGILVKTDDSTGFTFSNFVTILCCNILD